MARMMTSGVSSSATIVEFSVTGVCCQSISKVSDFTVRVPRNRMSQGMQTIHQMGGKIIGVSVTPSGDGMEGADHE